MPRAAAAAGFRSAMRSPSISIVPAFGATVPPRMFISVDLPAPFSPIRPTISPPSTDRDTSRSATTPG
jgi:hypothetical protein